MVSPIPSDLKHILKAYDLSSSEKTSGHISIKKGHIIPLMRQVPEFEGKPQPPPSSFATGKKTQKKAGKTGPNGAKATAASLRAEAPEFVPSWDS